jgi:hypothetical protein
MRCNTVKLYSSWNKGYFYIFFSLLLCLHTAEKHHSVILAAVVDVQLCSLNYFDTEQLRDEIWSGIT